MQCHASGEARCSVVISVVIGICLIEFSVQVGLFYFFHFVVLILLVVILCQFIPLFSRGHFSHVFSLFSHNNFRCGFLQSQHIGGQLCRLPQDDSLSSVAEIMVRYLSGPTDTEKCDTSAPLRRATQICEFEVISLRSGKTLPWFLSSASRTL